MGEIRYFAGFARQLENSRAETKRQTAHFVGTADTFHLDEAVRLLDAELKKLGSDAKVEYLEGRTHFDMYQDGFGK